MDYLTNKNSSNQLNNQKISKKINDINHLEVNSIFKTIQGEGPFSGQPAIFVRLAGCNLQCPFCDTEYTKYEILDPCSVISRIKLVKGNSNIKLVVITGGEPFRQNIYYLVQMLLNYFRVQIETNGTIYRQLSYDHKNLTIVCSPKTAIISSKLKPHIDAYKYVLSSDSVADDGLPQFALGHKQNSNVSRPDEDFEGPVYVQPMDSKNKRINELNIEACKRSVIDFGYTLCLQTHKIIGVE